MPLYDNDFYANRHENTLHAAQTVIAHIADVIPTLLSVVDLGCGIGTWLSVAKEKGAAEIMGIDGSWVDKELLTIRNEDFLEHNLAEPLTIERTFDLAMSLEVAEHLPAKQASAFVKRSQHCQTSYYSQQQCRIKVELAM